MNADDFSTPDVDVESVDPETLKDRIDAGEDVTLLDARMQSDYKEWRIDGENITSINVPYFEFLEDDIDEAEDEQRDADLARKRMQAAKAVKRELDTYYEQFQQSIGDRANDKVDDTFNQVATKNYEATITDDFELLIRDRQHGTPIEVDKSRGERQIASLSFIGSLIRIAREQYESASESEYFDGGIYPILMDSPFGALDNEHRAEVSQVMPMLAEQVIVLVTDAQWEGPVQQEMGPNVGAHYELEYEETGGIEASPVTELKEISRRSQEVVN